MGRTQDADNQPAGGESIPSPQLSQGLEAIKVDRLARLLSLRLGWWLLFVIVCVSLVWIMLAQDFAYLKLAKQYEKDYLAFDQAAAASIRRTGRLLHQLRVSQPPPSKTEVEELLNGGRPFETRTIDGIEIGEYKEPVTGRTCELQFRDARLLHIGEFDLKINWPAAPQPSARWWMGRQICQVMLGYGFWVWLIGVLVVIYMVLRSKSRVWPAATVAADALLMMSLLVMLAGFLRCNPFFMAGQLMVRRPIHMRGIFMAAISLGVVLWNQFKPRTIAPGLCQVCEYDLTGNVSGVCPECGEKISCTGSGEQQLQ
ncbi:MAG: hypothetical protein ACYTF1_03310 [Planctomycetota bacterium]|jgi:hypothetical protein